MGGNIPLGYRVQDRRLLIEKAEAYTVRFIFNRFLELGSWTLLSHDLKARGIRTRTGSAISKSNLYRMLHNRIYIGEISHKDAHYPGRHEAIIAQDVWDKVQGIVRQCPRQLAGNTRAQTPALLKGLLFGPDGAAFSPTHTRKGGKLYRYYVSQTVLKHGAGS
jgi:site-specific DNA recombinase